VIASKLPKRKSAWVRVRVNVTLFFIPSIYHGCGGLSNGSCRRCVVGRGNVLFAQVHPHVVVSPEPLVVSRKLFTARLLTLWSVEVTERVTTSPIRLHGCWLVTVATGFGYFHNVNIPRLCECSQPLKRLGFYVKLP